MSKVLVLTAHPNPGMSRVNTVLSRQMNRLDGVTVIDLYALYPRFKIDVTLEQQRLQAHDIIVFQFPIHWYAVPPLLRQWQDDVLEYGFAYGRGGEKLAGKLMLAAVTAGGAQGAYAESGSNRFTLRTLLAPLEQTASLCRMQYLPPLVMFAAWSGNQAERIDQHAQRYVALIEALRDQQLDMGELLAQELFTELPLLTKQQKPIGD